MLQKKFLNFLVFFTVGDAAKVYFWGLVIFLKELAPTNEVVIP